MFTKYMIKNKPLIFQFVKNEQHKSCTIGNLYRNRRLKFTIKISDKIYFTK